MGRLWFPTIRGAVVYTPGPEAMRLPPPPVLIEELRVDGRRRAPAERDHIPRGEGQVEIHYTSAGLRAPQQLRFRYRLEGVDADWVEAGTRRVAYYTRLPPGELPVPRRGELHGGRRRRAERGADVLPGAPLLPDVAVPGGVRAARRADGGRRGVAAPAPAPPARAASCRPAWTSAPPSWPPSTRT